MESSDSAQIPVPYKSKKPFASASRFKASSGEAALASKTPDSKPPPAINPTRARNRGVALSISDIRKAAENLRQSNQGRPIAETKSARKQILSWESPIKKPPKGSDKLPEKYEMLNRFFCNLEASIKLSRMRASVPTFTVLSKQIECLSERRFTYQHLSQLKYILPEVIEIKRDLVLDEQTTCMKPDLRITLNIEAVKKDPKSASETARADLRKLFHTRLLDFIKTHPEGEEIPEEPLPPAFNRKEHNGCSEEMPSSISSLPPRKPMEGHSEFQATEASHLAQSFQRRFSRKIATDLSTKASPNNIIEESKSLDAKIQIYEKTLSSPATTPMKKSNSLENGTPVRTPCVKSTPAKLASTPASATPELQPPPKRSCLSPEDGSTDSHPKKLLRSLPRNRSLKFDSPLKSERVEVEMSLEDDTISCSDDVLDILSDDLVQSIREKERKALEERDPAISRAKKRRMIIAGLPKLFNTVYFLFQSLKRSVITREELVYQIVTSCSDMVDRKEVEEALETLKELAPEWISKKVSSSGDMLFCVNKTVSASTVRARLAEAK